MYKKIGPVVKILLLFMIITAIYNYTAISVMAANKIVKVKNGTSGEIRIKEDDFVTFVPQLKNKKKKQSYFYYSPENGRNLFQFGNGKYWANKKGLATVMISGLDNQGNLNFMADYNVIIEKKRAVKDTNSGKSYNNQTGNTENSNVTTTTQAAIEKQLADVTTVTLSQSSLTSKRTKIGAYDNEVTSFKVDVNSKTELSETDNANVSVVSSNSNMKVTAYLEKNVLTIDVYNNYSKGKWEDFWLCSFSNIKNAKECCRVGQNIFVKKQVQPVKKNGRRILRL